MGVGARLDSSSRRDFFLIFYYKNPYCFSFVHSNKAKMFCDETKDCLLVGLTINIFMTIVMRMHILNLYFSINSPDRTFYIISNHVYC